MSQQSTNNGTTPFTEAQIWEKYEKLKKEIPGLQPHSRRLAVLMDESDCRSYIPKALELGITDIWLPMPSSVLPNFLNAGAAIRFERNQVRILSDCLKVADENQTHLDHFHLRSAPYPWLPKTLVQMEPLGDGGFGFVEAVRFVGDDRKFALKRIRRKESPREEREAMRYVRMELEALSKIRHPHFIRMMCGYTDERYIGLVMHPVAKCNLGAFLDFFHRTGSQTEKGVRLASFFGCLATALAHLHFRENIRHRDIKPTNILVQGQNVLLTDFGIALDFSETKYTTTQQEQMRSPIYCAPEVPEEKPRNTLSDIWSLGCVFLEMAAVLSGDKRDFVQSIIAEHGRNRSHQYYLSPVGISEVIKTLRKKEGKQGKVPLDWIEKMLQRERDDRINSKELKQMILESGRDNSLTYWGICYKNESLYANDDCGILYTCDRAANNTEGIMDPTREDVIAVQDLLHAGFDMNGVDPGQPNRSALHWAIRERRSKVVEQLLKNNVAMPGTVQDDECTVLHMAAKSGNIEILQMVMEKCPNVDEKSDSGWTPLHSAVQNGQEDAVSFLLSHKADPNSRVGGWTSLHSAAERGFERIAQLLLDHGAEVSPRNQNNGITPVYKAAGSGHDSVLRLLVEYGASIDERDGNVQSCLHVAASRGHVEVVQTLLELGAEYDAKDKDGATPLHWAAIGGHVESVRALLEKGAEINKKNDKEATALYLATFYQHSSTVDLLVQKGANVNIGNHHGWTPLLIAVDEGNLKLVVSLVEAAALEQKSGDGRTALHMSAVYDRTEIAAVAIEQECRHQRKGL